jgi:hypothetical protein
MNNNDEKYYGFVKENIYFIILYTHPHYMADDTQKSFADQKLQEALSRDDVDWIVVYYRLLLTELPN